MCPSTLFTSQPSVQITDGRHRGKITFPNSSSSSQTIHVSMFISAPFQGEGGGREMKTCFHRTDETGSTGFAWHSRHFDKILGLQHCRGGLRCARSSPEGEMPHKNTFFSTQCSAALRNRADFIQDFMIANTSSFWLTVSTSDLVKCWFWG